MARGDRNVNLVVRAKNEASRALDTISGALDELRGSQKRVEDGSQATGNRLEQLATVLGKLRQQVGGASALDRLATSADKASGSVKELEQATAATAADQRRLAAEIAKTERTIDRLSQRQQQLGDVLRNQGETANRAKGNLASLNQEIARGEATLSRSTVETQRFTDRMTRQEAALERTKARYRELAQAILATDQPSNRLLTQFEKTEARLTKQASTLQRTQRDYQAYTNDLRQVQTALPALREAQAAANAEFERAAAAQQKSTRALANVDRAARQSATELNRLQRTVEKNATTLERQDRALTTARGELGRLSDVTDEADASLQKLGNTVRRELLASLQRSQNELKEYEQSWREATAAVNRAVREGQNLARPSPELERQLNTARLSKAAYEEMAVAIQRMRAAVREAGGDVNALSGAQQTFIQQLSRVRDRIESVSSAQQALSGAASRTASASQRASAAATQQAGAHRQTASALRQQATGSQQAAAAMAQYNRRARESLSWTQRIHGEVIALATAYVGLFAAIEQTRGVVDAFQRIEAANNKMRVAFEGNDALAAREMRFIREEAERLGVQFDLLANQYANLATATRGTNIQGAQTRLIFQQIAEAARVQRLTGDQVQGVFKAIEQMASRGTVSMEELREQLGDRLPGAFRIAVEAMDTTADALTRMIENGELASEVFLPRFAQRLSEITASQLPAALQSVSAELGAFGNEIVKAQETVANAGFIEGLKEALEELTEFFQSSEGVRFFELLGAALGNLVRFLAQIPNYIQEIVFVLSLLAGQKGIATIGALADRLRRVRENAQQLPATLNATNAATRRYDASGRLLNATTATSIPLMARFRGALVGVQATLTTTQGRAVALSRTMRALRASLAFVGGVPGLIVTGISLALATWIGRTRDVIDTTGQHERQMQRLIDEYSRVREAAGDWAKAVDDGIGGITLDQLRQNFTRQIAAMRDAAESEFSALGRALEQQLRRIQAGPGGGGRSLDAFGQRILDLARDMRQGRITAADYQEALAELLRDDDLPDRYRELIENSADLRKELTDAEGRVLEAAAAVVELGGNIDEINPILRELVPNFEDLARAAGLLSDEEPADPMIALNRQLDELRGKVPSLRDELQLMEELAAIDEILETGEAIEGIDRTSEAFQRFLGLARQAKQELQDAFDARRFADARAQLTQGGRSGRDLAADLIRQREGFRATPYWDVNAFRAGFGSDTVTLSDGTVRQVTEGMRVSIADANRDLLRRIQEFQQVIRRQVGDEAFDRLNPQQQAVLTSNAYNYGSLEADLVNAVRSGSTEGIAQALRAQASDNGGVNRERREQEAFLFRQSGEINAEATREFVEEQLRLEEQRLERAAEYNDQLDRTLTRRAEDLQYVDGISREMAIQRALEDERLRAARIGIQLTTEQLQRIEQNAAAAWDLAAAEKAAEESKKRQAEAEERINLLQQTRQGLMEQIEFFEGQGDMAAAEQLRVQLEATTETLRRAIDQQIRFWEAARGGPNGEEAAAAIVGLQNLRNSLVETGQLALLTADNLGQTFGSSLVSGMNNWLAKIRETGNVFGSLREAFLQFASDFLLKIAQMIAQQAIFNALQAAFGGSGGFFGGVLSGVAGVNHTGGLAGTGMTRSVSPAWFTNAVRYHGGGIAGLKPGEVPSILERGEEVLPRDDPRHRLNGGGDMPPIRVINAFDADEFFSKGMSSAAGERTFLNFVGRNRQKIKQALG